MNPEAVSLSQQGELPQSLVPRLRAVGNEDPEATELFPHLYGPLGADAIMAASPIGQ